MKKIIIILLSAIWLTCGYGQENDLLPATTNQNQLEQIQSLLSKTDDLSGDFKQTQKIQLLSEPLISTGHFSLSKSKGLEWQQKTPFKSDLIVTADQIKQQIENNPPTIITREQQPIIFSFTNIFLSVFNGDTKSINEYFNVYFNGTISNWEITLTPKSAPLDKAITSIKISGGKYINSLIINETKNNQIIIQLFNIKES